MIDRPHTREPDTFDEPDHDAAGLARPPLVMPFGPYAGLTLTDVARLDPTHLLALVREGIGSAELRAAAAQALARVAVDHGVSEPGTPRRRPPPVDSRFREPPLPLPQPYWGRGSGWGGVRGLGSVPPLRQNARGFGTCGASPLGCWEPVSA